MTDYNESTTPTLQDQHRQAQLEHYWRPRPTGLGDGCCPWCGYPIEKCECED